MAITHELNAEIREVTGRHVKKLRQAGYTPAVVYGEGNPATHLQINTRELRRVLGKAGTNQLIALKVDGANPKLALARDIKQDVIKRNYLHVDFYMVNMEEKVIAKVPLKLTGKSPAVADHGGILMQTTDEVVIEALPNDLVPFIEIKLDVLANIGDYISVSDIDLPPGVVINTDDHKVIVRVNISRAAAAMQDAAKAAAAEAEAAKKK